MAKKVVRRPNLPQETLDRARRELESSGEIAPIPDVKARIVSSAAPARAAAPAAQPLIVRRSVDLRQEYHYVVHDMRSMALLAGAILIVLVALSFVI